jgi:hypothetical protein
MAERRGKSEPAVRPLDFDRAADLDEEAAGRRLRP